MKIVIVSDNHGLREPLQTILQRHADADVFIHCGDSEMAPEELRGYVSVRGNNDFYYEYPEMKILDLEGHRMMIVHGHHHLYMGQLDMLISKARRQGCDFVFYGHTHIYSCQQRDGVILLNPGSLSRNRDGTRPCYAVLSVQGHELQVERIEWKSDSKR